MLGHQQREVSALCLFGRILIAVAIYGHDAVGILIYHDAARVHTESTHIILKLLGAVYDLTLVKLIRQMGEQYRRKLHANAQIHTVGLGRNLKLLTDLLHPFASASSYGNNTFLTVIGGLPHPYPVGSVLEALNMGNRRFKVEIHQFL